MKRPTRLAVRIQDVDAARRRLRGGILVSPCPESRALSEITGAQVFCAVISDRPGGLADLARTVADAGASFQEVTHDRAFAKGQLSVVNAICTVETRDRDHIRSLHRALRRRGIRVTVP